METRVDSGGYPSQLTKGLESHNNQWGEVNRTIVGSILI